MFEKIDNIEDEAIQIFNLVKTLDDALGFAENENYDCAHLKTISEMILQKINCNLEQISNFSCEAAALQSEKNSRQ